MARCDTCGNDYSNSFEVKLDGHTYTFDCFECAAHKLAPLCQGCGCKVLGHGVQAGAQIFCGAHCARSRGISGMHTHLDEAGTAELDSNEPARLAALPQVLP